MKPSYVQTTNTRALQFLFISLLVVFGSLFNTTSAHAESADVIVERGLPELVKSMQLVVESVQERTTPADDGRVLGASTEKEEKTKVLLGTLQEVLGIYNRLLTEQEQVGRTIVSRSKINVTVPNGGEVWDSGVLNTITWTPYGYDPDVNPAKDVTAYLEQKGTGGFVTLGKVQESGKASIHWMTGQLNSATESGKYAPPGEYYIRVVNNVTGATDRSDKPFTLLPKPIKLSVNGSEAWTGITDVNAAVTISWEVVQEATHCRLSGLKEISPDEFQLNSGTVSGHIEYRLEWGTLGYAVQMHCEKNGVEISDHAKFYVINTPPHPPAIEIVTPNGDENTSITVPQTIQWWQAGVGNPVSIALYKNDMWYGWIKNNQELLSGVSSGNAGEFYEYTWTPANVLKVLPDIGAVYKIYITGQKIDGTGYLDDKSDSPYSYTMSVQGT